MSRKPKSQNLAVADFETDPFKRGRGLADDPIEVFCVGWFDGVKLEMFWGSHKACCLWLIGRTKKHAGLVFMHNGGNFDFHFLLEFLPVADCKFFVIGKRIVEIKLPWGCDLRDSFAIIPKALSSYAKEKIDYRTFEKSVREQYRRKILDYLASDLRNLFDLVTGFVSRFPLRLTLSSAIFKTLKKDYDISPERMDTGFDETFRPFFFGGRVQFWQLGRCVGPHTILDINSAYPYAMSCPHWWGGVGKVTSRLPSKNFEQCFFEIEALSLGAFPVRNQGGGIDFPEREGRWRVSGWELAYGLESGRVANVQVLQCYEPAETRDFSKFVHHFYSAKAAAKLAGNKDEEYFNKLALNVGYGKFALQPKRFREIAVCGIYDTPTVTKKERKAGIVWTPEYDDPLRGLSFYSRKSYREGIDKFVNVATAASITGFVRAMLLRAMDQCSGVVYCDTDSICAADVSGLKLSGDLGGWKKEIFFGGSQPFASDARPGNSFYIAGKKLYAGYGQKPNGVREWKTASKGVNLSPKKIVAVALGKVRQHTSLAPTYSVFTEPRFVRREIRRADQMALR